MRFFYFPESVYTEAMQDYLKQTGKNPLAVQSYCMSNTDFFIEIAFSYVEGTPYPKMKEQA